MLGAFPLGSVPLGGALIVSAGGDSVVTNDGLLSSTASLEGSYHISVLTADGLLTSTGSLEGSGNTSVVTADGLLTSTATLEGGPFHVSITAPDGLFESIASLEGTYITSVVTVDGLLEAVGTLIGQGIGQGAGLEIISKVGLHSTTDIYSLAALSTNWSVISVTVKRKTQKVH